LPAGPALVTSAFATSQRRADSRPLWDGGQGSARARLLGEYERAVEAYRASIADRPTAEAHTFLGRSLSYLGRIDEAIASKRNCCYQFHG